MTDDAFDIDAMRSPEAFPEPVSASALSISETHISWVALTGRFAYKIKKPVQLEFVDLRDLATRQRLCHEELRLNRRLAADLYCDVEPITRSAQGLRIAGDGPAVEYAVKMRQFPESTVLAQLLSRGEVMDGELEQFGEDIADFHLQAAALADGDEYLGVLRTGLQTNLHSLQSSASGLSNPERLERLARWALQQLDTLQPELDRRRRDGYVREGHGDLHARNVVRWQGRLVAFDCIEFDSKLRFIDTMNDVAFLTMDLRAHGRDDLSYRFLNSYLERTGDYHGTRLLPFFCACRALVRAMVDAISAGQGDLKRRQSALRRFESRLQTAEALTHPVLATLYLMHGPSGSGKSHVSEYLQAALPAIRMRSDVERRRGQTRHAERSTRYGPEQVRANYEQLLQAAEGCLQGGRTTLVDAAFLDAAERQRFTSLAVRLGVPYRIIACRADDDILLHRVHAKAGSPDPSEATPEVLRAQLESMTPFAAEEAEHVIRVDTGSGEPIKALLARLTALD